MSANMATAKRCGCGGGCGCGGDCGGQCHCESRCCDLECLVRPNFFCGQLLTDADLAAMVEWTRKRFALARYRDGWGIVCGLDLSCSSPGAAKSCCGDSKNGDGPAVYLSPGYAVDCCGNDLVVCEPMKVDLSSVCRPPDDPCNPKVPPTPPPAQGGGTTDPTTGDTTTGKSCFDVDRSSLFAVQVYLRYHENLAHGQRAILRGAGACGSTEACEYARILEQPCIHLEVIPLKNPDDDDLTEEERWERDLRERLQRQIRLLQDLLKKSPDEILKYLRLNPPFQLCYIEDVVCCLRADNKDVLDTQTAVQVGILLLQDWIAREMQCSCFACRPDTGVPLGTVILRRWTEGRRTLCKVYSIDADPRYRRGLKQQQCQILRAGRVGLTRHLGQTEKSVVAELGSTGVKIERKERTGARFANFDAFAEMVNKQAFSFDPTERKTLRTHVLIDPLGTPRIVGFE